MSVPDRTRVFIYGSCVSRDTFELMDHERYTLLAYVARQSLISAFGPRPADVATPEELSPFQRRMIQGDLEGDLTRKLAAAARSVDLLLWDLTDERLGVYQLRDGAYATRTSDNVGTSFEAGLQEQSTLIRFGSDQHRGLWVDAATKFVDTLGQLELLDRTLVLAPAWAERSLDGTPVPGSFGLLPPDANSLYEPYYRAIGELGVTAVRLPVDRVIASAGHRWGAAPFHYDDATYRALIERIDEQVQNARQVEPRDEPRS
ncbi:DUF6270 domain-containing protein [Cellulomonas fimi]|uniref:Uncharacterized protein n=1 Tax=Cellulomonas fimi TaxID=1708 RepID=A0A7Y0M152_CELFI|nr:DUF6270 domain-containing protein [Cellulomonas fimi]NMR20527.1 hypothetical protein [Cellulomonas fimi]